MNEPDLCEDPVCPLQVYTFISENSLMVGVIQYVTTYYAIRPDNIQYILENIEEHTFLVRE
jgi:hypothetical protein